MTGNVHDWLIEQHNKGMRADEQRSCPVDGGVTLNRFDASVPMPVNLLFDRLIS